MHARLVAFLLIIIIILGFIKVAVKNYIGVFAFNIDELNKRTEELRLENSDLNTLILKESSLSVIEYKAKERGFIECLNCNYLIK